MPELPAGGKGEPWSLVVGRLVQAARQGVLGTAQGTKPFLVVATSLFPHPPHVHPPPSPNGTHIWGGVTFRGPEKYDRWKFFIMRDQIWGHHQTMLGWSPFWIYREESCSLNICLPRDRMGEHASVEFPSGSELGATTLWPLSLQGEWYSGSASFSPSLAWLASISSTPDMCLVLTFLCLRRLVDPDLSSMSGERWPPATRPADLPP